VFEHVAATVHARALAVPHGEHAVVLRILEQIGLLCAPDGRRREVFVHAGVEVDVVRFQVFLRLPRGLVDLGDGRAAVAGDIACRVQAGFQVAFALQHRQADQGLGAGHEGAAALQGPFVVERDVVRG